VHLECETCGASLNVSAEHRTATCPYCASPAVIERPASVERPSPTFTVAFSVGREAAQAAVRGWLGSRGFFTKSGLRTASIDAMRGVYVPAFLYSALSRSQYQAEIGENYTETETYTTTDSSGKVVTRTRTVTRTEHRRLAGNHAAYILDVLVTASRGLSNAELEALEPFDFRSLRRYSPALLAGWIAEEPTLLPAEYAALARSEALEKIGWSLSAFMPGDSHQGLVHSTTLERETADLLHVPVWILAVRHHPEEPPLRVLVNGQTAKVIGNAPLSWVKILLVVLGVIAVVALVILLITLSGRR
jgi:hypothetical protein